MQLNQPDIEFQILDWRSLQEELYDDDLERDVQKCVFNLYGRTRTNKTICARIINFTPTFYIEIDKNWSMRQIDSLMAYVKSRIYPKEFAGDLLSYERIKRHKFYGFTNYELFDLSNVLREIYKVIMTTSL